MLSCFNNKGFTLLEMVVAVGIFAIIVVSATAIFQSVVEGQKRAIAAHNTQENIQYIFESISKEIRNAKVNDDTLPACPDIGAGKIFQLVSPSEIKFKNQAGQCVTYKLTGGAFAISRVAPGSADSFLPLTPNELAVTNLAFSLKPAPAYQEAVAVVMTIENNSPDSRFRTPINMQTTVSSRYYVE